MIQPGGLQRSPYCHGLGLDLDADLRRARLRSSGLGFEHRGRPVGLRASTQLVERLAGDAVLGAEGPDRPAGCVIGPLRDCKANTRIDGFGNSHHWSLGAEVSPPRPSELSPMS